MPAEYDGYYFYDANSRTPVIKGPAVRKCRPCGGLGIVTKDSHAFSSKTSADRHRSKARECGSCRGRGWIIFEKHGDRCDTCSGLGRTPVYSRDLKILPFDVNPLLGLAPSFSRPFAQKVTIQIQRLPDRDLFAYGTHYDNLLWDSAQGFGIGDEWEQSDEVIAGGVRRELRERQEQYIKVIEPCSRRIAHSLTLQLARKQLRLVASFDGFRATLQSGRMPIDPGKGDRLAATLSTGAVWVFDRGSLSFVCVDAPLNVLPQNIDQPLMTYEFFDRDERDRFVEHLKSRDSAGASLLGRPGDQRPLPSDPAHTDVLEEYLLGDPENAADGLMRLPYAEVIRRARRWKRS